MSMIVQPMQWSGIADINEVPRFSDEDRQCFMELRDVLRRYGALERFGITLIHKHFEISDDEEMMEYTDFENRTLTIKPVKKSELNHNEITVTNWKLTESDELAITGCVCARSPSSHLGYHRKS